MGGGEVEQLQGANWPAPPWSGDQVATLALLLVRLNGQRRDCLQL
jgi:hypothetical protein